MGSFMVGKLHMAIRPTDGVTRITLSLFIICTPHVDKSNLEESVMNLEKSKFRTCFIRTFVLIATISYL